MIFLTGRRFRWGLLYIVHLRGADVLKNSTFKPMTWMAGSVPSRYNPGRHGI